METDPKMRDLLETAGVPHSILLSILQVLNDLDKAKLAQVLLESIQYGVHKTTLADLRETIDYLERQTAKDQG